MADHRIIEAYKACKQSFVAVGVFSGVANLLMLVPAFFMLNVYDKAVGNNSHDTLWVLTWIAAFLFVMLAAMEILRSRVLAAVASRLDRLLATDLYDASFRNSLEVGANRASTQSLVDLNNLRQFITGNGVFAIFDAPWLPIYLWVMFMFHPMLGWLGSLAAIMFFVIAILNQVQTAGLMEEANSEARRGNADTQRNLRNAEAITAMGMLSSLRKRWRIGQDKTLDIQQKASHVGGVYSGITKALRLAVQSAAIALGAHLVLAQEISPGMLIAGSILIGRALAPVEMAVGAWKGFVDAKGQYERIKDALTGLAGDEAEKMPLPDISGAVSFRSATIIPPSGQRPTISGVTFEIPAGNTCLIIGASGAGKSTLVRGLLGLWPTIAGEIRIDGAEAAKANREELGSQIGYLPQDIELLEGSVSENIARFGEVDSPAVVQAAKDAGIHEFILSLPNGYDTEIGKPGADLSPGQRQRVALARAIYGNPKLVVLDEPNSNLDDDGEIALGAAIQRMKDLNSTVVIVSHRTNILYLADRLLVMTAGRVSDFGPTDEVLSRFGAKKPPISGLASAGMEVEGNTTPKKVPRTVTVPTAVAKASRERLNEA